MEALLAIKLKKKGKNAHGGWEETGVSREETQLDKEVESDAR